MDLGILISIGSGILTIGIVWGVVKTQLSRLAEALKANNDEIAKHAQDLRFREVKETAMDYRLKSLEESRAQSVPREVFEARMDAQDGGIRTIQEALRSKASVGSMRRIDPRAEPDSDPPQLPPPRPRLGSMRDR